MAELAEPGDEAPECDEGDEDGASGSPLGGILRGEPRHQPIEHAAALRLIPNMDVWRPCDTVETAVAWTAAFQRHTCSVSIASRERAMRSTFVGTMTPILIRSPYSCVKAL